MRWGTGAAAYDEVMRLTNVEMAAIGGAVAAVLLVLLWSWLSRRGVARRITAIAIRLERTGHPAEQRGGLERALERLARAADDSATAMTGAEADAERLREALGAVAEGLVICDDLGRVVFRNDQAADLTRARDSDLVAEQSVRAMLDQALAGRTQTQTMELLGPPRRQLSVTACPLDDGRRTVGAVAVVVDDTDRRRLAAVRRDFVANVSHELQTPVGALALVAEAALAEPDAKVSRRLIEHLHAEARRLGSVLNDLVQLSRLEGEESPQRDPVPVHLVLAQAVDAVRGLAGERDIEISLGDVPRRMEVLGNRQQLLVALRSIVDNAVRYSDAGTTVEISTRTDGRAVEIVVRDHGIGIAPSETERVFERFYRLDEARARHQAGTGIGLSLARHVASSHGGDIALESAPGTGTTCTLRLPAGPSPVALVDGGAAQDLAG